MAGKPLRDERAKSALDLEIDFGDQIDRALFIHAHRAAEMRHLDLAGPDHGFDGRGEKTEGPAQAPVQPLDHADFHAAIRRAPQHDVVHEVAHEEDAAAAGLEDVLRGERIGDLLRIEAFAFVEHPDDQLVGSATGANANSTVTSLPGCSRLPCLMALMTDSRTATPIQCTVSSSIPASWPTRSLTTCTKSTMSKLLWIWSRTVPPRLSMQARDCRHGCGRAQANGSRGL